MSFQNRVGFYQRVNLHWCKPYFSRCLTCFTVDKHENNFINDISFKLTVQLSFCLACFIYNHTDNVKIHLMGGCDQTAVVCHWWSPLYFNYDAPEGNISCLLTLCPETNQCGWCD